MASILFYYAVIWLLSFVPGYLLVRGLIDCGDEDAVCLAPAFSVALIALVELFGYCTGYYVPLLYLFVTMAVAALCIPLALARQRRLLVIRPRALLVLSLFILFTVLAAGLSSGVPVHAGGGMFGDWAAQFERARYYHDGHTDVPLYFEWEPVFAKPFLTHLVASFFFRLFGPHYYVFQLAMGVMNAMVLLGVYLLARRLLGVKNALVATAILPLVPSVCKHLVYTWPKLNAAYFLFLSLYFYLMLQRYVATGRKEHRRRAAVLCGFMAGLAYLSHYYTLLFMLWMPIHYLRRGGRKALLAVARRTDVIAFLDVLSSAGLEVMALDVGPSALKRLVRARDTEGRFPSVLLANIGRDLSYLSVVAGRRLLLDREVSFGENRLSALIGRTLAIEEAHATRLLYRFGFGPSSAATAGAEVEIHRTISEILKPAFFELAEEVNKAMIYTASETRGGTVEGVFLFGSLARYPGAEHFLTEVLSIPAVLLDPFTQFRPMDSDHTVKGQGSVAGMALAAGLALRGLGE